MTAPGIAFAESGRHCLAAFGDGGVLLDVESGAYFDVDPTGAWLLRLALTQGVAAAARAGAARWRASESRVCADIESMLSARPLPRDVPDDAPLRFVAADQRVTLFWGGAPCIQAQADGAVRLLPPARDSSLPIAALVHMLLPRAASLIGINLLHAAALRVDDRVVVFSGASGAGKTTSAIALVELGGRLMVQDLLVLPPGGDANLVLQAEERLLDWKAEASRQLGEGRVANLNELRGIDMGARLPLHALLFLDATRRAGDGFHLQRLSRAETTVRALENSFLGSVAPADWRRYLATAARLSAGGGGFRVTAPAGLPAVTRAARDLYSTISAS